MSKNKFNVAIDGPAGAGKSSIARTCAARLGFVYVDTGALYRAIALYFHELDVTPMDSPEILTYLCDIRLSLRYENGVQRVFLNGEDVSTAIRSNAISMLASRVSAIPAVRSFLLNIQQNIAADNSVIMDGRDIGTVILPNADVKIFLTAAPEERAKRRFKELTDAGAKPDFNELLEEIKQRDYNDSHRETAPLCQAPDAILLDTTALNFDESVAAVLEIINRALKKSQ